METTAFNYTIKRTHYAGDVRAEQVGESVRVAGWVHRWRDHGGVIFIDLRDREGILQVVFNPEAGEELHAAASRLRNEYVIAVQGALARRPEGTVNPNLATGEVELIASDLQVLNSSKTTPFLIEDETDAGEELRLRYRYLDIRRPQMQGFLRLRHRVYQAVRKYFDSNGFIEIETPVFTRSTPEGARDYLVPARLHPGKFYALPQSPQLFKQLCMIGGLDKYYQIVRCFRDEDMRADRQPEFTQVDVEMSFVDMEDILRIAEGMFAATWKGAIGVDLPIPFPRLSYKEAMERYGTDKPDTRFEMELKDIGDVAAGCEFNVFRGAVEKGGRVRGLCLKGGAKLSRKNFEDLISVVGVFGAKGLAWLKFTDKGVESPIAKFFKEGELNTIRERFEAEAGDAAMFVADSAKVVSESLAALRLHLGEEHDQIDKSKWNFLWVVDFPLFQPGEKPGEIESEHHPFTGLVEEDEDKLLTAPLEVRSKSYDVVLNGYELGSGSIRNYKPEIQCKVFEAIGLSKEEYEAKFGFLLEALSFGAPPHGGFALGLDRIVALLAGADTIRDVIAFPKTQRAACLMTDAPSEVDPDQLQELGIRVIPKK